MKKMFLLISFGLFLFFTPGVQAQKNVQVAEIKTSAICDMCVTTISDALKFAKGVKKAEVDYHTGLLTVHYNPGKITVEEIKQKVSAAGYDADEVKADEKVYNELPACCKKGSSCDPKTMKPAER